MTVSRTSSAAALVAVSVGAVSAVLLSGAHWQTVTAVRLRPLPDEVLDLTGRTVEPAVPALGLVALAGVVAILATRGLAQRIVGALIVVTGLALVWRSAAGLFAVSPERARSLLADRDGGVGLATVGQPRVSVHAVWPILAMVTAVAVVLGGALVVARGLSWLRLSSRYDAPPSPSTSTAETDLRLWRALDRGDDPTSRTES